MTSGAAQISDPTKEPWHHEYYFLQSIVTGYNSDCVTIKKWSVTVAAGATAFAYREHVAALLYLAAVGTAFFWFTEAYWRANQSAFIKAIKNIEKDTERVASSPAISTNWLSIWREAANVPRAKRRNPDDGTLGEDVVLTWNALWKMRTWLPHFPIIVVVLALSCLAPPGAAKGASSCGASPAELGTPPATFPETATPAPATPPRHTQEVP